MKSILSFGGTRKHPDYWLWKGMIDRCHKTYNKDYRLYGAKGITVCKDWLDFKNFVKDMGPRPTKKHSVDRVNNSLGYSKSNCRLATKMEQIRNTRIATECYRGHPWTKETTIYTHNGTGKTRRCRICFENRIKK